MYGIKKVFIGAFLTTIIIGGYLIASNDEDLLGNNNVLVGTAASLFSLGQDITCTFEYSKDGQTMNGVVYITKNKNMRGDFITTHSQNGTVATHVIQKREYIYSWGSPNMNNFKTKINENGNVVDQAGDKYNEKISTRSDVQYSCKPWNVDPSIFELPESVVFQNK